MQHLILTSCISLFLSITFRLYKAANGLPRQPWDLTKVHREICGFKPVVTKKLRKTVEEHQIISVRFYMYKYIYIINKYIYISIYRLYVPFKYLTTTGLGKKKPLTIRTTEANGDVLQHVGFAFWGSAMAASHCVPIT